MNYNNTYIKYNQKFLYNNLPNMDFDLQKSIYKYCIVIPVYNEYPTILDTLNSINTQKKNLLNHTLVILVINNSIYDSNQIINNNTLLYQVLKTKKYNFEFISLDFFSKNKLLRGKNYGVGTARKIGMDFSLNYLDQTGLIFCLDADTLISQKYLSVVVDYYQKNCFQACTINFKHQKSKDPVVNEAIKIYENELYYIAKQIKNSNSPYGYVSMGSTIVCTVHAYIAVGGMPQRSAAEDFYFMQSLAKYTKIYNIKNFLIYPSSRIEKRVHLGTGYRMLEYKKNKQFKNLFFSKSSFKIIKNLILLIEKNYKQPYNELNKELNQYFDSNICNFVYKHKLKKIWDNINKNANSQNQFMLFFHQWFDALKIMQLLKSIN